MDLYRLNALLGFIPLVIAFSYFTKMPTPSKLLLLAILISILTEAFTAIVLPIIEFKSAIVLNVYVILFSALTGAAYYSKVKTSSLKLASIFIILSLSFIILHIGTYLRYGIHSLQVITYLGFCIYNVLFSLFYFFYVVVIAEEIDLLQDTFFLLTAGFFIFYMVSTIVLYPDFPSNLEGTFNLYIFKDYVYTFYLILITAAFLIDRKKVNMLRNN